jgi:4-hydroxy-tetrahydrodipicolinate synthase
MPKKLMTGSFVALITPFNRDGSVDYPAFRSLLKFHEDNGTSAILIMGSTGESSMLSPEEKKKIIVECAKMKKNNMPIFFGCTGNNTESTIATVRFAKDNGADGAILAAPAYICAPEADIERFFLDVADATDLPLGIYNNPPGSRAICIGTICCASSNIRTMWCTRNRPAASVRWRKSLPAGSTSR